MNVLLLFLTLLGSQAQQIDVNAINEQEVSPDAKSIPIDFSGNNSFLLAIAYNQQVKLSKSEFESSDAYFRRVGEASKSFVFGKLTGKSNFAFMPPGISRHYDADHGIARIIVHGDFKISDDAYESGKRYFELGSSGGTASEHDAQNAFGATTRVGELKGEVKTVLVVKNPENGKDLINADTLEPGKEMGGFEIRIPVPADKAETILSKLQVLFVGPLSTRQGGPVGGDTFKHEATYSSPFDISISSILLYEDLKAIIVFDKTTGEVFWTKHF
jgi:hypothetical protein